MSVEKTREEMMNGATPVIGVQIADADLLQLEVEVAWTNARCALVEHMQRLEYRDWTCACDCYGSKSHCQVLHVCSRDCDEGGAAAWQ